MENMAYVVESKRSVAELGRLMEETAPKHNFRILAVHDVQETLGEKGFKIEPLRIYELCNAGFAYKALQSDVNVAMFMPCKIVLRQDNDKTTMTLVRPSMISQMLPESGLEDLAAEVEKQMAEIMNEIK